jgi:hypothetical protein
MVPAAAIVAPATRITLGPPTQRSAAEIGAVESRDAACLAREDDGEKKSGEEEGDGRGQIEHREPGEVSPRDSQRDRNMQHDLQHYEYDHGIRHAQPSGERACVGDRQPRLQQIGEHAPCAQPKQGDGNREECKVVEEHDRK